MRRTPKYEGRFCLRWVVFHWINIGVIPEQRNVWRKTPLQPKSLLNKKCEGSSISFSSLCRYEKVTRIIALWTSRNFGHRVAACRDGVCRFWQWIDEEIRRRDGVSRRLRMCYQVDLWCWECARMVYLTGWQWIYGFVKWLIN